MNKHSILSYIKLYKDILDKHQIFLSDRDLSNIYQLILLVFELDDLYDVVAQCPPSYHQLANIKMAMISLMPNHHPLGLQAITVVFKAMKDESLLKANQSLNHYLKVCSQSIGAPIIMAYLASQINVAQSIWYSDTIIKFNHEITVLIRLANDYLDTDVDLKRSINENQQTKAIDFFGSKTQLKIYLLCRYVVHKLHYYFYLTKFKYLNLPFDWKDYLQAISCSESVLDWAFKVYVIDRNSCQ